MVKLDSIDFIIQKGLFGYQSLINLEWLLDLLIRHLHEVLNSSELTSQHSHGTVGGSDNGEMLVRVVLLSPFEHASNDVRVFVILERSDIVTRNVNSVNFFEHLLKLIQGSAVVDGHNACTSTFEELYV